MTTNTGKRQASTLSRGQRRHVRRVKQEAHHAGTIYRPPFGPARAAATPKKEIQTPPGK